MFDLYQEQILDRSHNPQFRGKVDGATHQADGENRSCGDEVHFELKIFNGVIVEVRHQCRACAICSASADLLAGELTGKTVGDLQTWRPDSVTDLLGIPLSPVRLKCALLPLETVKQAAAM